MPLLLLVGTALLATLPISTAATDSSAGCLPQGINSTDVVSIQAARPGKKNEAATVTVAQKLKELKAHCRKHKLVDSRGREIRFYQLIGCWGNPPADYQQQIERQAGELAQLRRRYRVIEMTCSTSDDERLRAAPPVANP
jgi:hypothetical protein